MRLRFVDVNVYFRGVLEIRDGASGDELVTIHRTSHSQSDGANPPDVISATNSMSVHYVANSATSMAPYMHLLWTCTVAPRHGVSTVDYHSSGVRIYDVTTDAAVAQTFVPRHTVSHLLGLNVALSYYDSAARFEGTLRVLRGAFDAPCAQRQLLLEQPVSLSTPTRPARQEPFRPDVIDGSPSKVRGMFGASTVLIELDVPVRVHGSSEYTFELVPSRLSAMKLAFGHALPSAWRGAGGESHNYVALAGRGLTVIFDWLVMVPSHPATPQPIRVALAAGADSERAQLDALSLANAPTLAVHIGYAVGLTLTFGTGADVHGTTAATHGAAATVSVSAGTSTVTLQVRVPILVVALCSSSSMCACAQPLARLPCGPRASRRLRPRQKACLPSSSSAVKASCSRQLVCMALCRFA